MAAHEQTIDDAALLAALRGARPEAARLLFDAYGGGVYAFARNRTGDPDLASEIVQDVMTRVWRAAPRFDASRGSFRAWVFQIARNAVADASRRDRRRPHVVESLSGDAGDRLATEEGGDDAVDGFVRGWLVAAALERLPAEHRAVLELVYLEQLLVAEAAERLGIPEGTVKSRCFYALRNLRSAFDELGVIRGDL